MAKIVRVCKMIDNRHFKTDTSQLPNWTFIIDFYLLKKKKNWKNSRRYRTCFSQISTKICIKWVVLSHLTPPWYWIFILSSSATIGTLLIKVTLQIYLKRWYLYKTDTSLRRTLGHSPKLSVLRGSTVKL